MPLFDLASRADLFMAKISVAATHSSTGHSNWRVMPLLCYLRRLSIGMAGRSNAWRSMRTGSMPKDFRKLYERASYALQHNSVLATATQTGPGGTIEEPRLGKAPHQQ
jgi:hypothetical protein